MKYLRNLLSLIVMLVLTVTLLPWNVYANYAIPAPEEFNVYKDSQTFVLSWRTSVSADYYVTQYKLSSDPAGWTNTSRYAIRQVTNRDPNSPSVFSNDYTPIDTTVSYDFRVFACDASGTQQLSDITEIDNQMLVSQNAQSVLGLDDKKYYAHVSEAFMAGEYNVQLVDDINESVNVGPTATAVIDLNGHTLTAGSGYSLQNLGNCTIKDTQGTGIITSNQGTTPVWNGNIYNEDGTAKSIGTLTIEGGTIQRAKTEAGADGNITTLRNYGNLYLNGGKVDGGWVLTGWDAPITASSIKMVTPVEYEVTTIGSGVDLSNATLVIWPHGLVRYSGGATAAKTTDQSAQYTSVSKDSLTSSDANIQNAAQMLAFGSYLNTPIVKPEDISDLSSDGSPVYPQADVNATVVDESGKMISATYDLSLQKVTLDDGGKVIGTATVEPGKSLTMDIVLADSFDATDGDEIQIKHTLADGTVKFYKGKVYSSTVQGVSVKHVTFDNPDGFSTFEILAQSASATPTAAATPAPAASAAPTPAAKAVNDTVTKQFLVTYLDCKGNTVSVQWIPYGGSAVAPAGYDYPAVSNVSSHQDIKPASCKVTAKFIVPNTSDKG